MSQKSSATVLEAALAQFRGELTVADASARSGLALRDAEEGLRVLAAEYAGHVAATSRGELIYIFPDGLVRPAETRLTRRIGRAMLRVASGVVRFAVRAWVSVVLVGYALVFLAILVALALRGGDDRDSPWEGVGILLRVIAEALFWTFHPFSPVALRSEPRWMHVSPNRHKRIPFYERVNRFVFGPATAKPNPREEERKILAEIRRQKGRIAPADVMRVTGVPRAEAERLLLRLVVDYQGDIAVSDTGAITYRFVDLRTTTDRATRADGPSAPAVWEQSVELPPLTGNTSASNILFALINGFNLAASGFVLANDLTLERLAAMLARMSTVDPGLAALPLPTADGIPLVLGAIPFVFSLALFALPIIRLLRRPAQAQQVARQNGWRAILRRVLGRLPASVEYQRDELARAWEAATGRAATDADLERAVRELGGVVDLRADGILVYRFDEIARELEELTIQRSSARDDESAAGRVVFSSADEGSGIREDAPARGATNEPSGVRSVATGADAAEMPPPADSPPAVKLLREEPHESLDFLERLLAESRQRRGK